MSSDPEQQRCFIELLDGVAAHPVDSSASKTLITDALKVACKVLAESIRRTAGQFPADMRAEMEAVAQRFDNMETADGALKRGQLYDLINEDWAVEAPWAITPVVGSRALLNLVDAPGPIALLTAALQG